MNSLRVIDDIGNKTDYETEFVPRIGERIVLQYGAEVNLSQSTIFVSAT